MQPFQEKEVRVASQKETRLRRLRKRSGLSQLAVSKDLEARGLMDRDHYSRLERGFTDLEQARVETLIRVSEGLAPHLNMTPGEIALELTGLAP